MDSFHFEPQIWQWATLGVALLIGELMISGALLLGLGVSALIVALILLVFPDPSWQWQLLIFGILSLVFTVALRQYFKSRPIKSDQPLLNERGQQYVGRTFTLSEPIVDGRGKINVDDSTWRVEGPDCVVGTRVHVTGVDGVVFKVEVKTE